MKAEKIVPADIVWKPAADVFGERVFRDGQTLVDNGVLSDRRADGAGVAYLVKFKPPNGKLLKVIATARSDEHVYLLEGAYCTRAGETIATPGASGLHASGRRHRNPPVVGGRGRGEAASTPGSPHWPCWTRMV